MVRKPPIVFCIVFEQIYIFLYMSFDFLFFLEEVHVLGWSWLIGCLSVISVLCNHSFRELYHM